MSDKGHRPLADLGRKKQPPKKALTTRDFFTHPERMGIRMCLTWVVEQQPQPQAG